MSLKRKITTAIISLFIINFIIVISNSLVNQWNLDRNNRAIKEIYLDEVFNSVKFELLGNILLNNSEIIGAFKDELLKSRKVKVEIREKSAVSGLTKSTDISSSSHHHIIRTLAVDEEVTYLVKLSLTDTDAVTVHKSSTIANIAIQIFLLALLLALLKMLIYDGFYLPILEIIKKTDEEELNTQSSHTLPRELKTISDSIASLKKEVALNASHKAISQTTQMLAHDVRRPFTILRSGLSLLKETSGPGQKEVIKLVEGELNSAVDDVNAMIADVMDLGNSTLNRDVVSISNIMSVCLKHLSRQFPARNVTVDTAFGVDHIYGDEKKLQRVFTNILTNAVEASKDECVHIRIESVEKSDQLNLAITNSGSYIGPDEKNRIFDPFFTRGKKLGTGLGLAICHKIIHLHEGVIRVESSKEENSTTFELIFPLDIKKSGSSSQKPVSRFHLKDFRILMPEKV